MTGRQRALWLRRKGRWFFERVTAVMRIPVARALYRGFFARRPIQKNKIVFDNYMGKGFGCNPKYVAMKLLERDAGKYDLVWVVSKEDEKHSEIPPQIRTVPYGSLRSLYEYATAGVWLGNHHKVAYVRMGLRRREGQFFIQTWHGSLGIKKIERSVPDLARDRRWLAYAIKSSQMTSYWISNGDYGTFEYKSGFWDVRDADILRYGHPRNDPFFDEAAMRRAREKVERTWGLAGKRLLLYAPTFRKDARTDCYAIDFARLAEHLHGRFGGAWVILLRLHPKMRDIAAEFLSPDMPVIDASRYVDMQELLCAADCLITDYSCCSFDFLLTRRPAFLFAADMRAYDVERGLYYPLEQTPFPLAQRDAELMANIDAFDEARYLSRVEAFLREKGCIEDGHASERVAGLIEKLTC